MPIRIERKGPQRVLRVRHGNGPRSLTVSGSGGGSSPSPLVISGTPEDSISAGDPYSFTPSVSGGTAPYSFALTPSTPDGFAFDADTGALTAEDVEAGVYEDLTITVTDSGDPPQTDELGPFTITASEASPGEAPILNAVTYKIGELTIAGQGMALLSSPTLGLVDEASSEITSWTVGAATTGTDAHWTRAGTAGVVSEGSTAYTPVPSSAGASAKLSSGTYVFPVTATGPGGTSDPVNITITVEADTANIGTERGINDSYPGAVVGTLADFCTYNASAPKRLALSTGATRETEGFGMGASWAGTTVRITLCDSDPTRPAVWNYVSVSTMGLLTVEALTADGDGPANQARFGFTSCTDLILTDLVAGRTIASLDTLDRPAIKLVGCDGVTITDPILDWNAWGIFGYQTDNVTVNNLRVRHFCADALFFDLCNDWTFNDPILLSPYRTDPDSHVDYWQWKDLSTCTGFTINRVVAFDADCNALTQMFFQGQPSATVPLSNVTINGALIGIRGYTAAAFTSCDAITITNLTMVKVGTGTDLVEPAADGNGVTTEGPWFVTEGGAGAGWLEDLVLRSAIIGDEITYDGTSTVDVGSEGSVKELNRSYGGSMFAGGPPRDTLDVITNATWAAMTIDQVVTAFKAACAPGSAAVDNSDQVVGALADATTWNEWAP